MQERGWRHNSHVLMALGFLMVGAGGWSAGVTLGWIESDSWQFSLVVPLILFFVGMYLVKRWDTRG